MRLDFDMKKITMVAHKLWLGHSKRSLELKIQMFFNKMRVRRVPEQALRRLDPHLVSFININSPPDLVRADAVWSAISKPNSINNR